jgi:hypothetical protein
VDSATDRVRERVEPVERVGEVEVVVDPDLLAEPRPRAA